jgi:hypothetical protein
VLGNGISWYTIALANHSLLRPSCCGGLGSGYMGERMPRLMLIVASFVLLSGLANAQVPERQWARSNHRNLLMCVWHPEIVEASPGLAECTGEPARRLYDSLDDIMFAQFRNYYGVQYFEKYSPPGASYGNYHIDCWRRLTFYRCSFRPWEMDVQLWELPSNYIMRHQMSRHPGRRQAARHYLIHSASPT